MSSASPGAERAALAILLRRRRSCSAAMSNTCVRILGSRRMFSELCGWNGEVEQEVDAKACLRVEEVRTHRRIETKPDSRHLAVGDRRGHISHFVQP